MTTLHRTAVLPDNVRSAKPNWRLECTKCGSVYYTDKPTIERFGKTHTRKLCHTCALANLLKVIKETPEKP